MITPASGRTPRGVRGLKCGAGGPEVRRSKSHPSRGAWIEMVLQLVPARRLVPSHPSRGAWIEIFSPIRILLTSIKSHPSRGAWMEIGTHGKGYGLPPVAPLAGCVD